MQAIVSDGDEFDDVVQAKVSDDDEFDDVLQAIVSDDGGGVDDDDGDDA